MILRGSTVTFTPWYGSFVVVSIFSGWLVVVTNDRIWNMDFTVSLIVSPTLFSVFPMSLKTKRFSRRLPPCATHAKATSSRNTLRKRRRKWNLISAFCRGRGGLPPSTDKECDKERRASELSIKAAKCRASRGVLFSTRVLSRFL